MNLHGCWPRQSLYYNILELAINVSIQERLVSFVVLVWQSLLDKHCKKGAVIRIETMIPKETLILGKEEGRSV